MEKLKPCPFCGGKAEVVQWRDTADLNATWVTCMVCDAMIEHCHHKDQEIAKHQSIKAWNKRADHEPDGLVTELVKALEKALEFIGRSSKTDWNNEITPVLEKALTLYKASGLAPDGHEGQEAPAALGEKQGKETG